MSNNTTKVNNPMKVITGKDTRWSYANVWEAKSINGGAPKFSVSLIIPKSDTVTVQKIKAAIEAAYHEGEAKLKGNGKSVPQLAFADATRKYIEAGKDLEGKGFDPRKLLAPGFEAIKATVKEKMELFGSVGKA